MSVLWFVFCLVFQINIAEDAEPEWSLHEDQDPAAVEMEEEWLEEFRNLISYNGTTETVLKNDVVSEGLMQELGAIDLACVQKKLAKKGEQLSFKDVKEILVQCDPELRNNFQSPQELIEQVMNEDPEKKETGIQDNKRNLLSADY